MEFLSLVLVAVGLAMDAFTVSVCKGLAMRHPSTGAVIKIGIWFGGFQALMPVIGYALGSAFYDAVSDHGHWVAFGLLSVIGVCMMIGAFREEEEVDGDTGTMTMLLLAVATSIDALAVGVSLAMDPSDIILSAAVIGVITTILCMIGASFGGIIGDRLNKKAEFAGGLILVLIGVRILLDHLL